MKIYFKIVNIFKHLHLIEGGDIEPEINDAAAVDSLTPAESRRVDGKKM